MPRPLKLILVGFEYGHQAAYGGLLADHATVELIGVCRCTADGETSISRGREFARSRGCPYLEKLDRALEELKPDVASLALPPADNVGIALGLIRRGIHVLCEKPVAPDAEGARLLVEAVEHHRVRFTWALATALFTRPIHDALELAKSGALGTLRIVNYRFLQPKGPIFANRTRETGGEFANFGAYGWVPLTRLVPYPLATVFSMQRSLFYENYKREGIDDLSITTLRFKGGAIGTLTVGRIPVESMPSTDLRLELIGSEGVVQVKNGMGDALHVWEPFKGAPGEFERGAFTREPVNDAAAKLFVDDFVAAILEGREPVLSAGDALSFARLCAAAERSSRERKVVAFE